MRMGMPMVELIAGTACKSNSAVTMAIDGTAHNTGGTISIAVTLTTTHTNDYIIVSISSNGSPIISVVGSTLGAFTRIAIATRDVGTHTQEIWAIFSPAILTSQVITVTASVGDFMTVDAFGVTGTGQSALIFDAGGPQSHAGPSVADPISITTVGINTMVIASFGLSGGPTETAGSGFTQISGTDWSAVEYKSLSAPATTSAALGTPSNSNGSVIIAIVAASDAKKLFLGSAFCLSNGLGSWRFTGYPNPDTQQPITLNNSTANMASATGIQLTVTGGEMYTLSIDGDWYHFLGIGSGWGVVSSLPTADTVITPVTPFGGLKTSQGVWTFGDQTGPRGNLILLNGYAFYSKTGYGTQMQTVNGELYAYDGVILRWQHWNKSGGSIPLSFWEDVAPPIPLVMPALLGVFRGESWTLNVSQGEPKIDQFETWLGKSVDMAQSAQPKDTWSNIEGNDFQLTPMGTWKNAKAGRTINYSVSMFPESLGQAGLAQVAAGTHDAHFTALANNLVRFNLQGSILRLGWEFSGSWMPWYAGNGHEADFAGAFRRIVTVMRAAQPTAGFKFDWNPNHDMDPSMFNPAYPGDAYVDYIGIDIYDQSWVPNTFPYPTICDAACHLTRQQLAWSSYHGPNLARFQSFLALHPTKQLSFPEWGLVKNDDPAGPGGLDNPYFMQQMINFIGDPSNRVGYQSYFDLGSAGSLSQISDSNENNPLLHDFVTPFPTAAALYHSTFGGATYSVVIDWKTGVYEAFTNPVTLAANTSIDITAVILTNDVTGSYIVQYTIAQVIDSNNVNIVANKTVTLVSNVAQEVTQTVLVPAGTATSTYRIDVKVYTPGFAALKLSVHNVCIFYVQAAAVTTLPYKIGVYRSAQDPYAIYSYENWLGRRMDLILDTIPSDSPGSIETSFNNYVNGDWNFFASQWSSNKSRVVVTMPMLPVQGNYSGPSLGSSGASTALANGAAGAYDSYWITLRQNMLAAGWTDNIIRLGWEMNGNWYNWSSVFNPTAWKTYFQRIVTILRNDPNSHFKFCFNPTCGFVMMDADTVYPGNSYIDYIGLDVYDTDFNGQYPISASDSPATKLAKRTQVWSFNIINDPHGLPFWKNFAATNSKPFGVFEWGCMPGENGVDHGGGDNTYFVQQMHDYVLANGVSALMYFDLSGLESLFNTPTLPTAFPNAAALYQTLFGPNA